MANSYWLAIGFVGQALFSARFIIQWLTSEKQQKSVIPAAFWYFSIVGSLTLLSYALYRKDPVFVMGQTFGVIIYLRNIYFINPKIIVNLIIAIVLFFSALSTYLFSTGFINPTHLQELRSNNTAKDTVWQLVGFIGQIMFSMRFILQWWESEKQKKSVIPISFWYFSMFGSIILLAYATYQQDPVFIVGQTFGMMIYLRNLYFIFKATK